jgi:pimeloyl-ACP methyl ester carboxylesterase
MVAAKSEDFVGFVMSQQTCARQRRSNLFARVDEMRRTVFAALLAVMAASTPCAQAGRAANHRIGTAAKKAAPSASKKTAKKASKKPKANVNRWDTLPLPPVLPAPVASGDVASAGAQIHYMTFGPTATASDGARVVVLMHGGMGNSDQMTHQVAALQDRYRVITIDSRGQGRSAPTDDGIHYAQMADDVIAVLDELKVERATFVGWSDGGVIGLQLGIRHPTRVASLWLLATNYNLAGMQSTASSATFGKYWQSCAARAVEYGVSTDDSAKVRAALRKMWRSEPEIDEDELRKIEAPTIIALGDHDELIKRPHAKRLATLLPHATFVLLQDVSHFALWQDPDAVNASILGLLSLPAK